MTLREALDRSTEDIQRLLEQHRRLLDRALDETLGAPDDPACRLVDCAHRRRLREVVVETVEVLEQTRKAFKSSQLEALRIKLIRTLGTEG